MDTPPIFIVVEPIGSAYWIQDGDLVCCALFVDGTPDFDNYGPDEYALPYQVEAITNALRAMEDLVMTVQQKS